MAAIKKSIAFIAPLQYDVDVDGESVLVSPLCVQGLGEAAGHVDLLMAEFASAPPEVQAALVSTGDAGAGAEVLLMAWATNMVSRRRDALIDLIAIAIRQDRAWVAALLPDRAAALLLLIIEVNVDFFSRARPLFKTLASAPGLPWNVEPASAQPAPSPSTGPTPSSSSSPTGTGTSTS